MSEVPLNDKRQIGCLIVLALIGIDYFGASPAADLYI